MFEVSATEPTFERESGPDGPVSMNSFDAVFPAKGSTSSDFQADAYAGTPGRRSPQVGRRISARQANRETVREKPFVGKVGPSRQRGSLGRGKNRRRIEKEPAAGIPRLAAYGNSPVGWPLRIRSKIDGAEMALVTGGVVTVGHDGEPPESSPQIRVVLDSFYMDLTEVTLDRYERLPQGHQR